MTSTQPTLPYIKYLQCCSHDELSPSWAVSEWCAGQTCLSNEMIARSVRLAAEGGLTIRPVVADLPIEPTPPAAPIWSMVVMREHTDSEILGAARMSAVTATYRFLAIVCAEPPRLAAAVGDSFTAVAWGASLHDVFGLARLLAGGPGLIGIDFADMLSVVGGRLVHVVACNCADVTSVVRRNTDALGLAVNMSNRLRLIEVDAVVNEFRDLLPDACDLICSAALGGTPTLMADVLVARPLNPS